MATRPSDASTRLPYMPGLDGLRAIAVISVLLYHAAFSWAIGGFLGVEVFFVISGYLITSLLLSEWRDREAIDLRNFWLRRARRLLPALFVVIAVTTLVAVIFLPGEVASLRGDVLSALAYVTNWNFIFAQKSYFEALGRPSLVQHLWSLAVEEQFYLVWPLLFIGGMKVFGRKRFPIVVVAGAIASVVLMWVLYVPGGDPSRVYYGTDTRAAGLLVGCALAFVWSPWRLRSTVSSSARTLLNVVGAVGLVLLLQMLWQTDEFSSALYRGGLLRLDLITAVVIAVLVHPAGVTGSDRRHASDAVGRPALVRHLSVALAGVPADATRCRHLAHGLAVVRIAARDHVGVGRAVVPTRRIAGAARSDRPLVARLPRFHRRPPPRVAQSVGGHGVGVGPRRRCPGRVRGRGPAAAAPGLCGDRRRERSREQPGSRHLGPGHDVHHGADGRPCPRAGSPGHRTIDHHDPPAPSDDPRRSHGHRRR